MARLSPVNWLDPDGLVVAVEINPDTYHFAEKNLKEAGYNDIQLILGDGTLGYPPRAPYDAISITASTPRYPPPILEQMAENSRLVAPVGTASSYGQDLLLVEKIGGQLNKKNLMRVVYVPLIGKYGYPA